MPEAMVTIRELRAQRAQLWEQAKGIHEGAQGRDLTAEERQQWDGLNAEMDTLKARIDREERAMAVEASLVARETEGEARRESGEPAGPMTETPEYRAAFNRYLRDGMVGLEPEERKLLSQGRVDLSGKEARALGVGAGPTGGFTVPDSAMRPIIDAAAAWGGVRRSRATVLVTNEGGDLPVPLNDDTNNLGVRIGENQPVGELDPAFAQKVLRAYMYTSRMVRVPYQFLQDTAIADFEGWLYGLLYRRIGRITNEEFTNGLGGGNMPEGILAASVLGHTSVVAATVDYNDLTQHVHSVDPDYRDGAQWMMHDQSLAILKGMVDGVGRPLWVPGVAVREPDRLCGFPYIINQDMPPPVAGAFVTGTLPILFGDMSYYWIRDVRGFTVVRVDERYVENLQVGFLGYSRHDGALLDAGTHPIRHLLIS
jgi:HK97 family phage major capsid protein